MERRDRDGLHIYPEIGKAHTLPGRVYGDPELYRLQVERVFARSWQLVGDAATSRDYHLEAHWALYWDNYLEEFHIPYVHGGSLTGVLDYETYRTERFRWGNLQFGMGKAGEATFALPAGHPDEGEPVVAFYFWLFPNLMLNFYPWGLSINVVRPLAPSRTRVSFLSYVQDAAKREEGAGANLHHVEMEDEAIVESAQRGVRSRLYRRGRYSPRREVGTHHFHQLLAELMADAARG
jgi:choline monooxygenase